MVLRKSIALIAILAVVGPWSALAIKAHDFKVGLLRPDRQCQGCNDLFIARGAVSALTMAHTTKIHIS